MKIILDTDKACIGNSYKCVFTAAKPRRNK